MRLLDSCLLGWRIGLTSLLCLGLEARAGDLTIAAAASLQAPLEAMRSELEALVPGQRLLFTTGASGTLKQQIIHGAPIDIFLSAGTEPMDELVRKGYVEPTQVLLNNQLLLIGPESSTAQSFQDLTQAKVKRIALGEPRSVPAGNYAVQALKSLKLEAQLSPKFVYAKDVRQVLSYVQRGDVDAGFVYLSDFRGAPKVRLIAPVPPHFHQPLVYPIAIIRRSEQRQRALPIVAFLKGPKAAPIWQGFGFTLPSAHPIAQATPRVAP